MTNAEGIPNDERPLVLLRHSGLVIPSSFVIRHSHPLSLGKTKRAGSNSGASSKADWSLRLSLGLILLRVTFRLELGELIGGEDGFGFLHILMLALLGASFLVMLGHQSIHLRLLLGGEIEVGHRDGARHVAVVPRLLSAIAMFAREHGPCGQNSCSY